MTAPWRLLAAEKALLALGLIAIARTVAGWFMPSVGEDFGLYSLLLIGQQLLLYGLPAIVLHPQARIPTPRLPEEEDRPGLKRLAAIAGTAALHQGALVLVTLVFGQWLAFMGLSVRVSQPPLPQNGGQAALAVLALAVIPALCEESLFRGRVLKGLQSSFAPRTSLFLTAGLFALMHGQLANLPAHLAAGFMLTALCMKDGLMGAMAYHFTFNLTSLALSLCEGAFHWQGLLMASPPLLMALMGLLILLGVLCAWALLRGLTLEKGPQASARAWYWVGGVALLLLPAYLLELLPR
ncbi:MAG: CPBP family intramembrane metalloprotease [Clostridia bacterium]|nr:CPBP family intramembrane metalloprotease [Clostridia bacterium]